MGAQAEAALLRGGRLGVVPASFAAVPAGSLRPVPPGLVLDRVARSHGWVALPPFGYDGDEQHLFAAVAVASGTVTARVDSSWTVTTDRALAETGHRHLHTVLRWCLGLDDDVTGAPPTVLVTRMLRSATVWEDLAKTLMTTNCSFSATTGMVGRLVETLGTAGTFPSPEAVVDAGLEPLRGVVRMGYRAPSLLGLAAAIGEGREDPESWRHLPDDAIVAAVAALPGFGRYSAEGMLGLLGRPRGLAVDSWIRARLGGCSAAEIARRYDGYGAWAGSVLWQDVTAPWFAPRQ